MDNPTLGPQARPQNSTLIIGVAIAFLFPLALTIVVTGLNISYYDRLLYSRFIYWATVLVLLLYALKVERQPLLIWPDKPVSMGTFALTVLALYLLCLGASMVSAIPMLFGWRESNEVMKLIAKVIRGHEALLIFISLTAGVTEELIFRGYLLTRLSQLFKGQYVPVIVSSVLFSALHYRYNSLREFIVTFLIGLIFGAYYVKYRNIKVLMVTHFMIDFISLTLTQFVKM